MSSNPPAEPTPPNAGGLDAYTEFLGLPPGDRPPHHYDLLEIELFCPHKERIEHAVRRQFRRVKPFEEHSDRTLREAIQDVMTHIATARVVLTDPDQKLAYDAELAAHLGIDRDAILRERLAARPPEYALTVIGGGDQVGARLELLPDQEFSIGSDSRCTFALPGQRMAPRQAVLEFRDEAWHLQAADGRLVLVNDHRVDKTLIDDGDIIDLAGYRLRVSALDAQRSVHAAVAPPLSLIVRQGPSIPEPVFNALAPCAILIGSCDTALWQLPGKPVALHHARVESNGALWEITDLHSDTGTFVNGDQVRTAILTHRDRITIGRFEIQVSLRR